MRLGTKEPKRLFSLRFITSFIDFSLAHRHAHYINIEIAQAL
jgi:hypothetical protein